MLIADVSNLKLCPACDIEKGVDQFGENVSKPDGLAGYCLVCMRGKRRKSRIESGHQKPDGWVRKTADKAAYRRAWKLARRQA